MTIIGEGEKKKVKCLFFLVCVCYNLETEIVVNFVNHSQCLT